NLLSCINCRQRKIRCDKRVPCGACQRSGAECTFPSQRAPRRKQNRRNEELLRRLDHLEGLVDRLGGEVAVSARAGESPYAKQEDDDDDDHAEEETEKPHIWMGDVLRPTVLQPRGAKTGGAPTDESGLTPVMQSDGSRYLSEDFWTSLSGEVEGLRDLLNEPSDDEDTTTLNSPSTSTPKDRRLLNSLFVFSGDIETSDLQWLHPHNQHIALLGEMYWNRVDPVFKVLHRPTVMPRFYEAVADIRSIPKGSGTEALMFAMYFAAISSMTPGECLQMMGRDRDSLADQYRHCCEMALANTDFINSADIVTLQAFLIYLMCLRCHNKTRSVWTLLALAVRIAHDLNLHRDGATTGFTPFQTEIRRRIWWQITVLDVRACEDRGSFPIIDQVFCNTKIPSNVNDEDIWPEMTNPPAEKKGGTEMTFSLICHEASRIAPKFYGPIPVHVTDELSRDRWQNQIQEEEEAFKQKLVSKYLNHLDSSVPYFQVCQGVAKVIMNVFWLLVHYPIQTKRLAFKSKATKREILVNATNYLASTIDLEESPLSVNFRWYYETYVLWHPIAVTLAELCVQTRGPDVERAWRVVDAVYGAAQERVTDVSLWRPVKKLYEKAKKAREQ
ncbi:hypothetical protein K490DRAFT_23165, partial [Saccharata proteae CBS 121410]